MKAIIENGNTYKVISERGAFTVCEDSKGKCKMFETSKIEVVEINEMPKAKVYKSTKTAEKKHAEKMDITAHHAPLTDKQNADLDAYMEKQKRNSISW